MADVSPTVLRAALDGDRRALRAFVQAISPVVQARVVRGLLRGRRAGRAGRDVRQEIEDMTQEVFGALFAHDGHALRAWDPARGLSLANFVGLVADRQVASILRSGRRNPWRDIPEELDELEPRTEADPGAEPRLESRQKLELLLERLRASLSPRGLELFQRLYVDEEPIAQVAATMKMTREAIYAWRNRVTKLLARFATEIRSDDASDPDAAPRNPSKDGSDG